MTRSEDPNGVELSHLPCPACGTLNGVERDTCCSCGEDLSLAKAAVANAQRHYNQAVALAGRGELDVAEIELLTAIEYWSREPRFHTLLGTVYARRGLFDLALRSWEAAIEVDPQSNEAYECIRRARHLERQARLEDEVAPWRWWTAALGVAAALLFCFWIYTGLRARGNAFRYERAAADARALRDRVLTMEAVGPAQPPAADVEELRTRVEKQSAKFSALQADLATARAAAQRLEDDLAEAKIAQASLETSLLEARTRLEGTEQRAVNAEQLLAVARIDLASESALRRAVSDRARDAELQLQHILTTIAVAAPGEATGATAALSLLEDRKRLQTEVAEARIALATATAELHQVREGLASTEASLHARTDEVAQVRAELDTARAELAAVQQRAASAEHQLAGAEERNASAAQVAADVERLRGEVAAASARAASAETRIAALAPEVERLRTAIRTYTSAPIEDAVRELQSASTRHPGDAELDLLKRFAENELRQTKDPAEIEIRSGVYYRMANELYRDKKYEEAYRYINKAVEVLPSWLDAQKLRERIERELKDRGTENSQSPPGR